MKTSKNNKTSWLLPLHIQNLASLTQLGLIVDATGMPLPDSNIFDDNLKGCTGKLSLYRDRVPLTALGSGDNNAKFCALVVDIEKISAGTVSFQQAGNEVDVDILAIVASSVDANNIEQIDVPGPLPFSIISEILFEKKEHKDSLFKIVDSSSAPIVEHVKVAVKSAVFEKTATLQMSSDSHKREYTGYHNTRFDPVYAFGGALAHIFYLAKNSKEYTDFFDAFEKLERTEQEIDVNAVSVGSSNKMGIKSLEAFFDIFAGNESKISFILEELIAESRVNNSDSRSTIIQYLKQHEEPTNQKIAESLISKKDRGSFIDGFNLDHFKKSNALYFLFKLVCDDNLERILNPVDEQDKYRVLFNAVAFGMKFKFENINAEILKCEGLSLYISHKMASYYHDRFNTGVEFKAIKRPKTLFEVCAGARLTNIDKITKLLDIAETFETKLPTNSFEIKNGYPFFKGVSIPKFVLNHQAYFDAMLPKNIDAASYNKLKALK